MTYGKKIIGKLVKKCTKDDPSSSVPSCNRRHSGLGRLSSSSSVSSRSWSRGSSRSDNSNADDADSADDAPVGVPEGCLAVYVGPDMRRFVVQASFLSNPVFRELLRRSEEEYGFETEGGLRIPCEAGDFEKLLWQMPWSSIA